MLQRSVNMWMTDELVTNVWRSFLPLTVILPNSFQCISVTLIYNSLKAVPHHIILQLFTTYSMTHSMQIALFKELTTKHYYTIISGRHFEKENSPDYHTMTQFTGITTNTSLKQVSKIRSIFKAYIIINGRRQANVKPWNDHKWNR